jgi:hypothetical protein
MSLITTILFSSPYVPYPYHPPMISVWWSVGRHRRCAHAHSTDA